MLVWLTFPLKIGTPGLKVDTDPWICVIVNDADRQILQDLKKIIIIIPYYYEVI